jgi:hypothetical protein
MRPKRASPLTRAMLASSDAGVVKPCKPPWLRKECVTDQSGGDKGEACGWERTLPAGPSSRGREPEVMNSSGWCRGPA